jgi:hypothetical protein
MSVVRWSDCLGASLGFRATAPLHEHGFIPLCHRRRAINRVVPKTGASVSCNHSFSLCFLSPGVNVLRRGSGFHANDRSGSIETLRNSMRKKWRNGRRESVNAVRFRARKKCVTPCVMLSRFRLNRVRESCVPRAYRRAYRCVYPVRIKVRILCVPACVKAVTPGANLVRKKCALAGTTKCVSDAHRKTGESASPAHGGYRTCPVRCVTQGAR